MSQMIDYRSQDRDTASTFRMSAEDKVRLKAEALREGLNLQQLFELRMLGQAKPRPRDGRPRKLTDQAQLPIEDEEAPTRKSA